MEHLKTYFEENPAHFGYILIALGIAMLVASIKGSKWLFEKDVIGSTYSLNKLDGWINIFGKKTARVVAGICSVLLILVGVFWVWLYKTV
ncbi:Imm17 family immunity protein [Bacteroides sp. 224]|uniref:Imm17 family immunity protein n=1 Tax=Bacteroides sp. 224 TaxID=2302936 RepID=UPI0013D1D2F2|nr:Imm17 family immunity protein [Bacteroides sp. 224]NDV65337.1 hypothetical protein [Bacteroides sp. 224]